MQQPSTSLASAFHHAAQVTRSALYGTPNDQQLPLNLQSDARIPFVGFCGPHYRKCGVVLLAINPGGGGDAYASRTPQDSELIALIDGFIAAAPAAAPSAFERMCASYAAQVQTWNLWRILRLTMEACRTTVEHVCYLNAFPYRTAKDARPASQALNITWLEVVAPLLQALQPSLMIALGKKLVALLNATTEAPHRYSSCRALGATAMFQRMPSKCSLPSAKVQLNLNVSEFANIRMCRT